MPASAATLERAARALEQAPADESSVRYFFAHPVLLRDDLGEDVEGHAGAGVLEQLRWLRQVLADRPELYDIGGGPVEQLWQRVDQGALSTEQACLLASNAAIGEVLSATYVKALSRPVHDRAEGGDWRGALCCQRIVLAGLDAAVDATLEARRVATRALLDVTHSVLRAVPDRRLVDEATTRATSLEDELLAEHRPERAADLEWLLGISWLDAYGAETGGLDYELLDRRWEQRGLEEHTHEGMVDDPAIWRMPARLEAMRIAEAHLRRALEIGGPGGYCDKALLQTLSWRRLLGDGVEPEEMILVARKALAGLDPEVDPRGVLYVLESLIGLGERVELAPVEAVLAHSSDELVRRHGRDAAIEVLARGAQLLGRDDPQRTLEVLPRLRPLLAGAGSGTWRRKLFEVELRSLQLTLGWRSMGEREPGGYAPAIAEVTASLEQPGTDVAEVATALICLASMSGNGAEELAGLAALDDAERLAPVLAAQHADLVAFARATLRLGCGVNAFHGHDYAAALASYAEAIRGFASLSLDAEVGDCLSNVYDLGFSADPEAALAVAAALDELEPVLERQLGRRGTELLSSILERLVVAIVEGFGAIGPPPDTQAGDSQPAGRLPGDGVRRGELPPDAAAVMLRLLQVAKGHRFGAALAGGLRPLALSSEQASLLAGIDSAGVVAPAWPSNALAAEAMLVSAHATEPLPGRNAAERVMNLQLRFDELYERGLAEQMLRQAPLYQTLDDIRRALDPSTVLVVLYGIKRSDEREGMLSVSITADEVRFGAFVEGQPDPQVYRIDTPPFTVTFPYEAAQVAELRLGAQSGDPALPASAVQASRWLYERAISSLGPDLARHRDAGRTHLCVVPDGRYHFVPHVLLAGDSRSLGEDFVVTALPNLALLLDRRGPPSVRRGELAPMAAFGLGFAGRRDVEPIPEAIAEASEIAALFGAAPVHEDDATKSAVLEALQSSRRVHLATHGEDNPPAPSLQPLLLAGGERLLAHEVARLDLSHLELVTLGACESALGRVDEGDNMSGLVASLFLAGASTVVGTLWRCRSQVSRLFFTTFYAQLVHEGGVLDAYATAQRTTRAAFPAPGDWAAFSLLGAWS